MQQLKPTEASSRTWTNWLCLQCGGSEAQKLRKLWRPEEDVLELGKLLVLLLNRLLPLKLRRHPAARAIAATSSPQNALCLPACVLVSQAAQCRNQRVLCTDSCQISVAVVS